MNNRPFKVNAFGEELTIDYIFSPEVFKPDLRGQIDHQTNTISISEGLDSRMKKTLLHELIHFVSAQSVLGLTENQVQGLENGLFHVIKDNPVVRDYIFG